MGAVNSADQMVTTYPAERLFAILLLWLYYGKSIRLTVKVFYAAFGTIFHCSDADCVLCIAIRFAGLL